MTTPRQTAPIAEQLKRQTGVIAERFDDVSVFFADIADFTVLSGGMPPEPLVETLNDMCTRFDELARAHGVEKIKFIYDLWGDTVNMARRMESSGLPGRIHDRVDSPTAPGGRRSRRRR